MRTTILSLTLLLAVPSARAQDEKELDIRIPADMPLVEFLEQLSTLSGKPLLYDPKGQRIANQTMGVTLDLKMKRSEVFDSFRGILAFYELVLTPVGGAGREVYLVLDTRSTNNIVKNKARFVPEDQLDKYADKDGLYLCTTVSIKHMQNLTSLRTALSTMVSPAGIGRVHEATEARALILTDFAPTVCAMVRMIHEMDRPPVNTRRVEVIRLANAPASEVVAVLAALQPPPPSKEPPSARAATSHEPDAPRFAAYTRLNAVVVECEETDLERVREAIAILDVKD
jgi:type II secretory pathway component GspD/PulD (secretin)